MFTEDFNFFTRRPALRVVVFLSAGILLAHYLQPDPAIMFSVTAALFLTVLATSVMRAGASRIDIPLALLVVLFGVILHSSQREEFGSKKLTPIVETEGIAFRGAVAEEVTVRGNRVQIVVATSEISRNGRAQMLERRVIVHGKPLTFEPELSRLELGASVQGIGELEEYPLQRNPGEFDYGRYLELNDIHGVIVLRDSAALNVFGYSDTQQWQRVVRSVRNSLLSVVDRMHGEQEAGYLRGILLSERSKIPADIRQAFVDTGTIHVIAVSGLHVSVVALIFYGAFGLFRLPRKMTVLATMVGLVFYMFLVGAQPSVVRATVMALALLVGMLLERKLDVYQSLGVAALALLLWDSENLFNGGFQLSFAAVFSIVYFYPFFSKFILRLPENLQNNWLLSGTLKLFAVSLAAQIGTLPFTAYYFDRVSLASLLANLVAVPVSGLNITLGFTTLVCSVFSDWLAQSYAALNEWLVAFLLWFVKVAADVPYSYIETAHLDASFPFLYYAGLFGLVNLRNTQVVKSLVIAGLVAANVLVYSSVLRTEERALTVTFIDVWQGDAILLEFPSGKNVLLDAGGKSDEYDAGERVVAPFLKYNGIDKLDALVMSHPHSDHIGGVAYLLEHFEIGRLIEPMFGGETAMYQDVHRKAAEHSIPVQRYGAGDMIQVDADARLYVLHPYFPSDSAGNLNNASLVITLVYGSSELLLVGDVERTVEEKLLRRYKPLLRSTMLKVGHHGSGTSSTGEFIEAIQPRVAVISVGRNNKFKHPSPSVLRMFRRLGIELHRTDREGAIVLKSDGKRLDVKRWREE